MKKEEIIFWILFIVSIGVVLWYLLGKSPSMEQALLILVLTLVFKNSLDLRTVKLDLQYTKSSVAVLEQSVTALTADVTELKRRVNAPGAKSK